MFEASISGPTFTIRTLEGDQLGRFRLDECRTCDAARSHQWRDYGDAPLALSPTCVTPAPAMVMDQPAGAAEYLVALRSDALRDEPSLVPVLDLAESSVHGRKR